MELLQPGDEFDGLFYGFERTACHLELRDSYRVSGEAGPFEAYMRGEPDDYGWHEPWLSLVRDVAASGRQIQRARLVTVPHTDYTSWGLKVARLNVEAGEHIRYLPRHRATSIDPPPDDFWLFDDKRLVATVFTTAGEFVGGAEIAYPGAIEHCRRAWHDAWAAAVPWADYADE